MKWIVLKFGGTSVAGYRQWELIADLIADRLSTGTRVVVVCSAVAGVTNRLTELADCPQDLNIAKGILDRHRKLGTELGVAEDHWLATAEALLQRRLAALRRNPGPPARAGLLAVGEWLSTQIGSRFLRDRDLPAHWVDARDALAVMPEENLSPARRWLSAACRSGPDPDLSRRWSATGELLITQGFVARAEGGGTALLGRGGSDTSAALLAGRMAAQHVEIWTDVPGLFSADPRGIPAARLLAEVDYAEALEMAASGARVVHPQCIRTAAETETPILVKDLGRPDQPGTRIGPAASNGTGIKTVTCQRNIAVMLLQNVDARRQVGFLAGVFDVFRRRGLSIDLVATSETTTTVAINRENNHLDAQGLDALEADLEPLCRVRRFDDCTCVNLVGRGASTSLARLGGAFERFQNHSLLMASQSANDLCLSLLVPAGDEGPLMHAAHEALIPRGDSRVFGRSWAQLQGAGGDAA